MANNTVRKHCGEIQTILDLCGPPTRDNREGLGLLLDDVPYLARARPRKKAGRGLLLVRRARALVENAEAALCPKNRRPSHPAGQLFSPHLRAHLLDRHADRRRDGRDLEALSHDGATPHLWLPPKVAAKGRVGKRIELNEQARAVIESMRGYDAERIFPWPRKWPARGTTSTASTISFGPACPEGRQDFLAYHALRKLHTNELAGDQRPGLHEELGACQRANDGRALHVDERRAAGRRQAAPRPDRHGPPTHTVRIGGKAATCNRAGRGVFLPRFDDSRGLFEAAGPDSLCGSAAHTEVIDGSLRV
jgi:hypothetical protein